MLLRLFLHKGKDVGTKTNYEDKNTKLQYILTWKLFFNKPVTFLFIEFWQLNVCSKKVDVPDVVAGVDLWLFNQFPIHFRYQYLWLYILYLHDEVVLFKVSKICTQVNTTREEDEKFDGEWLGYFLLKHLDVKVLVFFVNIFLQWSSLWWYDMYYGGVI